MQESNVCHCPCCRLSGTRCGQKFVDKPPVQSQPNNYCVTLASSPICRYIPPTNEDVRGWTSGGKKLFPPVCLFSSLPSKIVINNDNLS